MPDMEMGVPGASPAPSGAPMAPPAGSPAIGDPKAQGEIEQAKANVQIAISMLEQSLPVISTDSDEGKALLKALSMLSKAFGSKKASDIAPAQLLEMMSGMPESYKQQMSKEMGGGGQPEGIPGGAHAPANLGV